MSSRRQASPNTTLHRTPTAAPPSPVNSEPFGDSTSKRAAPGRVGRLAASAIWLLLLCSWAVGDSASFPTTRCGIRFSYPQDWTVDVSYPKGAVCRILLDPPGDQEIVAASPGMDDEPCYLGEIAIDVTTDSLQSTLEHSPSFSRVDGVWNYRPGTIFGGPAEALSGASWKGYKGASTSHLCGAAQTFVDVVLGRRTRSLTLHAHVEKSQVLNELLRSLQVGP